MHEGLVDGSLGLVIEQETSKNLARNGGLSPHNLDSSSSDEKNRKIRELIKNTLDKATPFANKFQIGSVPRKFLFAQTSGDHQSLLKSFKNLNHSLSTKHPIPTIIDTCSLPNGSLILNATDMVKDMDPHKAEIPIS